MNNINKIFTDSRNSADFASKYLLYLSELMKKLDLNAIARVIDELEDAREHHHTIFIAGNGGSASTATHMANDFGLGIIGKGSYATPFRAFALTDNAALMTAIANDDCYQNIFINQLKIHYRAGDKLIVISASGNSPNVVEGAQWVKSKGGTVIGFTGFDGGQLKDICDVLINIDTPKGEYGPVEDIHMILDHLITTWLNIKLKRECRVGVK